MGKALPYSPWRFCTLLIVCMSHLACGSPETRRYHVLPTDPPRSLILAANIGDAELARLALNAGAPVNDRDSQSGMTPLMVAAQGQRDGVVRVLLHRGADPAIRDKDGHTALWHAGNVFITGRVPGVGVDLHVRLPSFWLTASGKMIEQAAHSRPTTPAR